MGKRLADDTMRARFLRALYTGTTGQGLIELRAIPQDRTKPIQRLWADTLAEIDEFADKWGERGSGYSVYYGVCKRDKQAGTKADISSATALWVDIDADNHGWDMGRCMRFVHELTGPLQPSCIIRSGGGIHLYWFLDEPHTVTAHTNWQQVEDANKALAEVFSGDQVHDITRIMRLPDTYNPKRKAKCELVTCYGFSRRSIHDLVDAALSHDKVMFDGSWMRRADAEKKMATPLKGAADDSISDRAYALAGSLTRGKTAEKDLDAMWANRVRYKPTRGYIGIDEAVMTTTARLWCSLSRNTKDASQCMDAVVMLTWQRLKSFAVKWEGGTWNEAEQKDAIRRKLARWVPKWRAIQAAADADKRSAAKPTTGTGNGKRGKG